MIGLERGRYRARVAAGEDDLAASLALRSRVFAADRAGPDRFDATCRHVLVEDLRDGGLAGSYRLLTLARGDAIGDCYAAQFYDLAALSRYPGRMLEMGRFCVAPGRSDPDVLRLAWAALTRIVDREAVRLLFGCASFPGLDPEPHAESFAHLGAHHAGPDRWRPARKAASAIPLARRHSSPGGRFRAPAAMPPLIRSYLAMGGWVGDHAVPDPDMGTLHVFTGLEIRAIPAARQRLLRAVAGDGTPR